MMPPGSPTSSSVDDGVVSGVGVGVRAKDILAKLKHGEERVDGQVTYPAIPHDLPAISPTSKLALSPQATLAAPSAAVIERRRQRKLQMEKEVIQPWMTDYEVRNNGEIHSMN